MAPIYESDLAEERWAQAEWGHYELWERLELRLRRRKRIWISAAILLFLILSAIPVLGERLPAWRSLAAARSLGQEINRIKADAAVTHRAYRISFPDLGSLAFVVERLDTCVNPSTVVNERSGRLSSGGAFALGDDVPGVARSFCYDPMNGAEAALAGRPELGFVIGSVKDLAAHRLDRAAVLLVTGDSAEISFE